MEINRIKPGPQEDFNTRWSKLFYLIATTEAAEAQLDELNMEAESFFGADRWTSLD